MKIIYYPRFINELDLSNLTAKEQDLFFYIISKLKFNREISLRADEIRDIVSYQSKKISYKETEEIAQSLVSKFPKEIRSMFDVIQVDYADKENTEFDGMWVALFSEYYKDYIEWYQCALDLDKFRKHSSITTKTIFRLLCNARLVGILNIHLETLKSHLNTIDKDWYNINKYIILPSKKKLSSYFKNLKVSKDGNMIRFSFTPIRYIEQPDEYYKLKKLHFNLTKNIGRTLLLNNKLDEGFIYELAELETKIQNISAN